MPAPVNHQTDILAVQRTLNALGHIRVNEDGLAGPRTWYAIAHELGLGIDEVSTARLADVIAAVQRKLAGLMIYKGPADGIAGRLTWEALRRALDVPNRPPKPSDDVPPPEMPQPPAEAPLPGIVDDRSEHAIETLHPHTQPIARLFIIKCNAALAAQGLHAVITSGTRTYAEQAELYAQGRSRPGKVVTNAPAGFSNHNFGLAFDVTLFVGSTPVWESPLYRRVLAPIGKKLTLSWGGDWANITDEPHYEDEPAWARGLTEGRKLAELRRRHNAGEDAFA